MSDVLTASARRQIVGIAVNDGDDALSVSAGFIRDAAGALRTFFGSLSASTSPGYIHGYGASSDPVDVSTETVTVTAEGGVAPLTYEWEEPAGWSAHNPTGVFTWYIAADVDPFVTVTEQVRCKVTDDAGTEAWTGYVTAAASNLGSGIGVPL